MFILLFTSFFNVYLFVGVFHYTNTWLSFLFHLHGCFGCWASLSLSFEFCTGRSTVLNPVSVNKILLCI
jgi:hypothetical protein